MSGGYDPTQTIRTGRFFKLCWATFSKLGSPPLVVPRTPILARLSIHRAPLSLPAGDSAWATAPERTRRMSTTLVDSKNPKIKGLDGAGASLSSSCTRSLG